MKNNLFPLFLIITVVGLMPGNASGITPDIFPGNIIKTHDDAYIRPLDLDMIHFTKKAAEKPVPEGSSLLAKELTVPCIPETIHKSETIWVEVLPETDTICVGDIVQLEAWVRNIKDNTDHEITWLISDAAAGSINENGLFTARKSGVVVITAYSGKVAASAKIFVTNSNTISADAQ